MNMDRPTAERWVTISAVIVIAVYAYRRFTEPAAPPTTVKKLIGADKTPAPLGSFATAWGVVYLTLSVVVEASPGLGGAMAILIAASDLLTNMPAITSDVGKNVGKGTTPAAAASSSTSAAGGTQVISGLVNPNRSKGGAQIVAGRVTQGIGNIGTAAVTF